MQKGEEYIVEDLCPPICHELWNSMYPMVYTLLNGGDLDFGTDPSAQFDIKCPEVERVWIHREHIH